MDTPTIPGYQIIEMIGRGGMGVVYKATREAGGELVALKLIRGGSFASPQERDRMRIEPDAMSRLQHPNIVRIYEFGEVANLPYLVMEFVPGASLDKHLASKPIDLGAAVQLVRSLALAIQHAHEAQIVHRDIKPANILLRNNVSDGQELLTAVITDFGLAKRLDSDTTAWTQMGNILGSASYMAPEQAEGSSKIGPAADIYALGTILYELLAGRPPFSGESWTETIRHVIHDEPPQFNAWNVPVHRDLQAICFKCLEKRPDDRYASAAELADELQRFTQGESITAATISDDDLIARYAAKDGYTIASLIASGPRAKVYRASYGQLNVPVALKVFQRDVCSSGDWDAKLQEGARLSACIDHPHVVIAKQMGWWHGFPYVAYEYAASGSLEEAIADRKFTLEAALRIVDQLTEAICYLHRQGVIHGNLKPSNIMLAADGNARMTDMRMLSGLAFGPVTDNDSWRSLAYVPPEMLDESDQPLRPVTDVYGLGVILYTLLAGRPPFVADSREELIEKIRTQEPEPIANFNSSTPLEADEFCRHAMRKSPWWRFPRAYDALLRIRIMKKLV